MDAKEFRINNYYIPTDSLIGQSLEVVTADDIKAWSMGAVYGHKILLSGEWLLKFGFEEKEYEGVSALNGGRYFDLNNVHIVDEFIGGEWQYIYKRGEFDYTRIKHVHHLQNLFFVLTGEELNLKNDDVNMYLNKGRF